MSKKGETGPDFAQTRYFEMFYRASRKTRYAHRIQAYRKKHGIPDEGFASGDELVVFLQNMSPQCRLDMYRLTDYMIRTCPLPADYMLLSIVTNCDNFEVLIQEIKDLEGVFPNKMCLLPAEDVGIRRYTTDVEEENYIRLLVSPYASMNDVVSFVKSNWGEITRNQQKKVPDLLKNIKAGQNRRRDEVVYYLAIESKKVLEQLWIDQYGGKKGEYEYKEMIIASMLRCEGWGNLTIDNIKQIAKKERRKRKD